jgi:hypothetical protein
VDKEFYEEKPDWELNKLIPPYQRILTVKAFKVGKPRMIGDLGLRSFFQLRKKALELLKTENIDFVYIPIPSFYTALIGSYLFKKVGVKYGIDYIDPWVHPFPGSEKLFSRHWFSTQLSKILEPIAVKNASLITGVSEAYYLPVLDRNPHLKEKVITAAMPYGGEKEDHEFVRNTLYVRSQTSGVRHQESVNTDSLSSSFKFVYAGALLPKAIKPLEEIFKALNSTLKSDPWLMTSDVSFNFIGTAGKVKPLAEKYGLFHKMVFEHSDRVSYLDVLVQLEKADGIFILGSTEPHYTPSKVYQAVLSRKPILAVLHKDSTAVKVIEDSQAGMNVLMDGENDLHTLGDSFLEQFKNYIIWAKVFDASKYNMEQFDMYSAKAITEKLILALNKVS